MSIQLPKPMYVIRANKKNNWYLGVAHGANAKNDTFTDVAQNTLDFALYFKTLDEANNYLSAYLKDKKDIIKPSNIKYYEVQTVQSVPSIPNANIMMYNVCCWFSTEMYCAWRRNPSKYKPIAN